MSTPAEAINQFFIPLVGTPEHVADFKDTLIQAVRAAPNFADPYDQLQQGSKRAMLEAVRAITLKPEAQTNLDRNGIIGSALTINTLRALGHLYVKQTTKPQQIKGVRTSVSIALRHTYGIAFMNSRSGSINVVASSIGMSPRNPLVRAYYFYLHHSSRLLPQHISPRIFRAKLEEANQLRIEPRFRHVVKLKDERCPATNAKISTPEGTRSALLLFMKTIGEVVITDIYPQYFDIIGD